MPSDGNYPQVVFEVGHSRSEQMPNLLACLVSVHERHAAVREHQRVAVWAVIFDRLLYQAYCFFPVVANVYLILVLESQHAHESLDGNDVKYFDVNDHYTPV